MKLPLLILVELLMWFSLYENLHIRFFFHFLWLLKFQLMKLFRLLNYPLKVIIVHLILQKRNNIFYWLNLSLYSTIKSTYNEPFLTNLYQFPKNSLGSTTVVWARSILSQSYHTSGQLSQVQEYIQLVRSYC